LILASRSSARFGRARSPHTEHHLPGNLRVPTDRRHLVGAPAYLFWIGRMERQTVAIDYRPRRQFVPFHYRWQRFACIVTHRRAGRPWPASTTCTAARGDRRSRGRVSPICRRSSASRRRWRGTTCARRWRRRARSAPPRTRASCASTIRTTAPRCGSTAPTTPMRCAASISTASCSTSTPTWTRGCGRRSSARPWPTGKAGRCSSARPRAATPSSSCGGARKRRRAGSP
jgi:hypothetical protein